MRCSMIVIAMSLAGCGAYTDAQLRLVEQASRGTALLSAAQDQQAQVAAQLHALRRQRIDEGFDADVRQQQAMSPAWVIEHRRAYAAALDGLWVERQAWDQANAVTQQNIEATQRALKQLETLLAIQQGLWTPRAG